MKALMLPRASNNALYRILCASFLKTGASRLKGNLSVLLRSSKLQSHDGGPKLLMLINRIYLSSVHRYIDTGLSAWFLQTLQRRQFGDDISIDAYLISDFVEEMSGLSCTHLDRTEIENLVCREISGFMSHIYLERTDEFNEALLGVYEMLQCYLPNSGVKIHRFELTPTLDPVVFYTESVSLPERIYESVCS